MPRLETFDTPASLRDVASSSEFYREWHYFVDSEFATDVVGENGGVLFNPARTDVNVVGEKTMTWNGFPRTVFLPDSRDNKRKAYESADVIRDNDGHSQDEYFEWFVHRNKKGKIRKVTFVTEFRHYYEVLWRVNPKAVLKIYQKYVNPSIVISDLSFADGSYNYLNRWNVDDGILHYTRSINALEAAIGLAKELKIQTPPSTNNYDAHPPFEKTKTSVDPRVSYDVHMLIRKGLYVSLKDPIGIYILAVSYTHLTLPTIYSV